MWPASGCSKPAMSRRQVLFPEPEGPSIEKNSPLPTARLTPSTARTSPKRRDTLSKRTAGVISQLGHRCRDANPPPEGGSNLRSSPGEGETTTVEDCPPPEIACAISTFPRGGGLRRAGSRYR